MTLYRYYCRLRPPASDAIPRRNLQAVLAGRIAIAGTGRFLYGMADYTGPLTDEETDYYGLTFGGTLEEEREE